MNLAFYGAESGPNADALALASLVRDCVTSGVERRALHLRLSELPEGLREPHHRRMIDETLAPVMRPTRARRFELPGGDLVVVSPPPGQHLEDVRDALASLLPETDHGPLATTLRLPAEGARLLATVEAALGLMRPPPPQPPAAPPLPLPPPAALDAAIRTLATADIAASQRRQPIWRLAPGEDAPVALWTEMRVHLPDLMERLLPGTSLDAAPAMARRFRRAAERRLLADLARPQEARAMEPACLPVTLGSVTETEALRLDAALGPQGRTRLIFCVPLTDALADPGALALARRLAAERGWTLGLDEVEHWHLPRLNPVGIAPGMLRLRFRPEWLSGDAAQRAALDAALPEDRDRVVLLGADAPVAIAWAWQRGITCFMGRVLEARK